MRARLTRWHRRIGLLSFVLLGWLAVTGLLLNHTAELGLDGRVGLPALAGWYGLEAECAPRGWRAGAHEVVACPPLSWLGDQPLEFSPPLAGALLWDGMYVIAGKRGLLLLTPEGETVDAIDVSLLPGEPRAVGTAQGQLVLRTGAGVFAADATLGHWTTAQGAVDWAASQRVDPRRLSALERQTAAATLSWTRVLQDLHSGRFFGRFGGWLSDIGALSLLALGGIGLFLMRRPRRRILPSADELRG